MSRPLRPTRTLVGHSYPEAFPFKTLSPDKFMDLPRNQVQELHKYGKIDDTDWMIYRFYWRNSTFRWSNVDEEFDIIKDQYK
jgi:hypothetical protein